MEFDSIWQYLKSKKEFSFSYKKNTIQVQFTNNKKIRFSGKKTVRTIGYEKLKKFYKIRFIEGYKQNKFFLNDGPKNSENRCYSDYLKDHFFPYLKSNLRKIKLRPYRKLTTEGAFKYDEYIQPTTIYYEIQGNQWGEKIGTLEDAIEKAISCNKYTIEEIAFLVSKDIAEIQNHIHFLKNNGIEIVFVDGIVNFIPPEKTFQESSFIEGTKKLRQHYLSERSPQLIKIFKENLNTYSCSICGFSFEEAYGVIGKNYIEAHHIKPISSLTTGEEVSISDLIVQYVQTATECFIGKNLH